MTDLDAWASTIAALTDAAARRWPKHREIVWEIHGDPRCALCAGQPTWTVHDQRPDRERPTPDDHPFQPRTSLLEQILHALPRAEACINPESGIRSPNLDSGGRGGGRSDPVGGTGDAHLRATGDPRFTGPTRDTPQPAATPKATGLAASAHHRRTLTDHLRQAHSTEDDHHRRGELHAARDEALRALGALHRLLPRQADIDAQRFTNGGDPGCASCRRATNAAGTGPHHSPTRIGPRGRTLLCDWCETQTRGERNEWITTHPGQTPPPDNRFWPPLKAIEFRRDRGHNRITATQMAAWRAEERAQRRAKTKRRKAS